MKKKFNKIILGVIATLSGSLAIVGCQSKPKVIFNSYEDLNNSKVLIATNETLDVEKQLKTLMPNAKITYYSDPYNAIKNIDTGKWDGITFPESIANEFMMNFPGKYTIIEPSVRVFEVGLGLSKFSPIPDFEEKVNKAIDELEEEGVLKELEENWLKPNSPLLMDEYVAPENYKYTIHCGTYGQQIPHTYYEGTFLKGHDIDFSIRVANKLGCKIVFDTAEFPALLAGVSTGRYDMIASNVFKTDARKENFVYSKTYATNSVKLLCKNNNQNAPLYSSLNELQGKKKLACITGGAFDSVIAEHFPQATITYFDAIGDAMLALKNKKVEGFIHDGPVLQHLVKVDKSFGLISEPIIEENYKFGTSKDADGVALANEFNEWLEEYKTSGKLQETYDFWISDSEPKSFDYNSLTNINGVLNVGFTYDARPSVFAYDNAPTGFPMELSYEFCKEKGYKLNPVSLSVGNLIPSLISKKVDLLAVTLSYTEKRAEQITFTDTVMTGGVMALVRMKGSESSGNFFTSIGESFDKTFIRESRWKMILQGFGVTLLVTFFAFILANVFGGIFCSFSLSNNKFLKALSTVYSYIIQGTPVLVLLMILYYIIFGSTSLSPEFVAILGFGLVSGASLAMQFEGGIRSVDKGQKEASLALGFTRTQTFMGITMPQVIRKILPGYFAEIISLLKATSIVGYISVIDLTKAGDIIRSSTFEAFFTLIAIAIIYFAVAALLLFVLSKLQKALAKKRFKKEAK